jgi:hypothetical protein
MYTRSDRISSLPVKQGSTLAILLAAIKLNHASILAYECVDKITTGSTCAQTVTTCDLYFAPLTKALPKTNSSANWFVFF